MAVENAALKVQFAVRDKDIVSLMGRICKPERMLGKKLQNQWRATLE